VTLRFLAFDTADLQSILNLLDSSISLPQRALCSPGLNTRKDWSHPQNDMFLCMMSWVRVQSLE
jgi:hypothetical protein